MSDQQPKPTETVEDVVNEARNGDVPRRDFLRRVFRLGVSSAIAYKLLDETTAEVQAQNVGGRKLTTLAYGEEGGGAKKTNPVRNSTVTTFAVGEEQSGPPTTMAVGEENSKPPTTGAVGEEQSTCPTQKPTTLAYGEEGRPTIQPKPTTMRVGEESTVTTRAIGEESKVQPTPTTLAVGEEGQPSPPTTPKMTTYAVGEEGQPAPPTKPKMTTYAVGEESSGRPQVRKVPSQMLRNIPTPWKNFRRW